MSLAGFLSLVSEDAVALADMDLVFKQLYKEQSPQFGPWLAELFLSKAHQFAGKRQVLEWAMGIMETAGTLDVLCLAFATSSSQPQLGFWQDQILTNPLGSHALQGVMKRYANARGVDRKVELKSQTLDPQEAVWLSLQLERLLPLALTSRSYPTEMSLFGEIGRMAKCHNPNAVPLALDVFARQADFMTQHAGKMVGLFNEELGAELCALVIEFYKGHPNLAFVLADLPLSPAISAVLATKRFGVRLVANVLLLHSPPSASATHEQVDAKVLLACQRILLAIGNEHGDATSLKQVYTCIMSRMFEGNQTWTRQMIQMIIFNTVQQSVALGELDFLVEFGASSSATASAIGFALEALLECDIDRDGFYLAIVKSLLAVDMTTSEGQEAVFSSALPKLYYKLASKEERHLVLHDWVLSNALSQTPVTNKHRLLLWFVWLVMINPERMPTSSEIGELEQGNVLPQAREPFTLGEIAQLRRTIVAVLPLCKTTDQVSSLSMLCDCILVGERASTLDEFVCLSLERSPFPVGFLAQPNLFLSLLSLSPTDSSDRDGELGIKLTLLMALCARIQHLHDENLLPDVNLACHFLESCLRVVYGQFQFQRVKLLAALLNRPTEECGPVCRFTCLAWAYGALTEAFELLDPPSALNAEVVEAEEDQEGDDYDDNGQEEDEDDEDNDNGDEGNDDDGGSNVHEIVLEIWTPAKHQSDKAMYVGVIEAVVQLANRLRFDFAVQPESVQNLNLLLANVAVNPTFTALFPQSPPETTTLLLQSQLDLLQFVGHRAKLAVTKHNLMLVVEAVLRNLTAAGTGVLTPELLEPLWNLFTFAVDSPSLLSTLALPLTTLLLAFPEQRPPAGNQAMDTSKLLAGCFGGLFVQQQQQQQQQTAVHVDTDLIDLMSLLFPLQDILTAASTQQYSSAQLIMCKHFFAKVFSNADRLSIAEFALGKYEQGGDEEWLIWVDSIAFPVSAPPPAVAGAGSEREQDEAFARLQSFVAAKRLALASPRRDAPSMLHGNTAASTSALFRHRSLLMHPPNHLPYHAAQQRYPSRQLQDLLEEGGSSEDDDFVLAQNSFQMFIDSPSSASHAAAVAGVHSSRLIDFNQFHNDHFANDDDDARSEASSSNVVGRGKPEEREGGVVATPEETDEMDLATKQPEPAEFTSLQDEVYQRTYPALLSLLPESTRCVSFPTYHKAFRCITCSLGPICGVCAERCHIQHEIAYLPPPLNAGGTKFGCVCGDNCPGKAPRREMQRLPVDYLQPLLFKYLAGAVNPALPSSPLPSSLDFGVIKSAAAYFDMDKGGSSADRSSIALRKLDSMPGNPSMFAVCEGNFVSVCDLSPFVCLVTEGKSKEFACLKPDSASAESEVVLSSTDVHFPVLQVEFNAHNQLLMSGAHRCLMASVCPETGKLVGPTSTVCELANEFIKRAMWLPAGLICIVTTTRILVYSCATSTLVSYRAHGEILVDAVMLDSISLLLLCKSGCVLKHAVVPSTPTDQGDGEELLLCNYVVFHPHPIAYIVSSLTRLTSRSFLVHSSQGSWKVQLDELGESTISHALLLNQNHFDTSFQPCVLIRDSVLVSASCSVRLASSLCFTTMDKLQTYTPGGTGVNQYSKDRIVGLVDWQRQGDRIVTLLESGMLVVYWSKPSNYQSPIREDETVSVPACEVLFEHFTAVSRPTICAKNAYCSLSGSPIVRSTEACKLLSSSLSLGNSSSKSGGETSSTLTCAGREFEINIGLTDYDNTIAALHLGFGMEHLPKRILVFSRQVGLRMRHAQLDGLPCPVSVQIVLTRAEMVLAKECKGVRLVLVSSGSGTVVALKSLHVYSIANRKIDLVVPRPGRFNQNKEGHVVALNVLRNLRDAGRAAFRFPFAGAARLFELTQALERLRPTTGEEDEVLAYLSLARLCGVDALARAASELFVSHPSATCNALLCLFHAPIQKPVEVLMPIQESYSCDLCGEFPIRQSRWNCGQCEDFDVCEDCNARVPVLHPDSHRAVFERCPIPVDPTFCQHCGLLAGGAPSLLQLCETCTRMGIVLRTGHSTTPAVHPRDLCRALLLLQGAGVEWVRFLMLSYKSCNLGSSAKEFFQVKQRVWAIEALDLKLQCMACVEAHAPGTFTLLEVDEVIEGCLQQVDVDPKSAVRWFILAMDLCRHAPPQSPNAERIHLFRQLLSRCFVELDLTQKRLAFSLIKHHFGCAHDSFTFVSRSCLLLGVIAKLQVMSTELETRHGLVTCVELVEALQSQSNQAVWSKLRLDRPKLALALMSVAVRMCELGSDPTCCVEAIMGGGELPLPAFAPKFLLSECLAHPTNPRLRQAALRVLLADSVSGMEQELLDKVHLALSNASSVSVECLLLFAAKCKSESAAQLVPLVLDQLHLFVGSHVNKWQRELGAMHYLMNALPCTSLIHPFALVLTSPSICLGCGPKLEQTFSTIQLESLKATYGGNVVQYQLPTVSDFNAVSVDFSMHSPSLSGVASSGGRRLHATTTTVSHAPLLQEINTGSTRMYTATLPLGPCVPHGNAIKFEFVLHKSALSEQRCPRCAKPVPSPQDATCLSCGEMLNQCRQCRTINYGDPKALLCSQCGFCRLVKFAFTAQTRTSVNPKARQIQSWPAFKLAKTLLWDTALPNERAQFDRLTTARLPVVQAMDNSHVMHFMQAIASPELEAKYRHAYFACLEANAIRETMLRFQFPPNEPKRYELQLRDKRHMRCFTCEFAYQLAMLQLLPALLAKLSSSPLVVEQALPWLFDLTESLAPFFRFLPKSFQQKPVHQWFVDVVAACPQVLLTNALEVLARKRHTLFAVCVLEQLAVALRGNAGEQQVLYALEGFIRDGVQAEAAAQALRRVAALPLTISPPHKRTRVE
ncbi:hypothetical protein BASA81_009076 [Batrachochytrium salamandrivorans]|nr:hypothetical protein BASA81_009076 [Batrachochytrium salamandrivorans]